MDIQYYTELEDIILNGGESLTLYHAPQGWKLFVQSNNHTNLLKRVHVRYEHNNPNKRLATLTMKYVDFKSPTDKIEQQIDREIRDFGIATINTLDKARHFFDIILIDNAHRVYNNRLFWSYLVKQESRASIIFFDKRPPLEKNCFCFIKVLEVPGGATTSKKSRCEIM